MILSYLLLVYSLQKAYCSNEAYFECGAHGKFEYCIDGVPGCVVGCHCYPGYYFDTDTKICEPNIKLTQYRRQYNTEPTRVPILNVDYVTLPTPTTKSPIDEKVDAIAKDSDDLGDWLYNQFFKTIENQVINKSDSGIKTRRAGSERRPIKLKQKSHTSKKHKRSKKKKIKKKGLKSKLLQITEDDSLFDSSSTSSSSDSDETDCSSSESFESGSSSEHGHRKILMINKKPTPPLPSFIFLPNVETPFYPPIGLAAPALPMAPMPMYPMVPVPPMGIISTDGSTTTSTLITNTTTGSTTTTPVITKPEMQTDTEPTKDSGRAGNRNSQIPDFVPIETKKKAHRNKFMQRLREKMRNRRPQMEKYPDGETSVINDIEQSMELDQRSPVVAPHGGVDFEYLSQLIHKININETLPKLYRNVNPGLPVIPNMQTRRKSFQESMPKTFDQSHRQRPVSKADEVNDSYYTNLGKQIASLIRTIDSNGEHEIDVELQQPTNSPIDAMFNENRYNPRSYWERFVRSPLKLLLDKLSVKNFGDDLIKIENQVSMAAAIDRSLSLPELENIVNQIEYSQTKIKGRRNYQYIPTERTKPKSIYNLNINLLPLTTMRNDNVNMVQTLPKSRLESISHMERSFNANNNHLMHAIQKNTQYKNNHTNVEENRWTKPFGDIKEIKLANNFLKAYYVPPVQQQAYGSLRKNVTHTKPFRAEQTINYPQNPVLVNYKSVNLVTNNRPYSPFNVPLQTNRKSLGNAIKPSYFHNELNQYDYFNQ